MNYNLIVYNEFYFLDAYIFTTNQEYVVITQMFVQNNLLNVGCILLTLDLKCTQNTFSNQGGTFT